MTIDRENVNHFYTDGKSYLVLYLINRGQVSAFSIIIHGSKILRFSLTVQIWCFYKGYTRFQLFFHLLPFSFLR